MRRAIRCDAFRRLRLAGLALVCAALAPCHASAQRPQSARDQFEYRPANSDYWSKVDLFIKIGKPANIFALNPGPSSQAESDEVRLGIAKALIAVKAPLHAQYLLTGVAAKSVGTRQGFEALRMISTIAKAGPVDESYLEDLAFDLDTKVDEPESRSMIGYFRARALLRKGYPDWAKTAMADIQDGTSWAEELKYDRTLQILNSGDTVGSYDNFESLSESTVARRLTVEQSKLALARLIFERKDYKAAISTYLAIDVPTRERARSLHELAWSYYYDRAYGKALGAIQALKSPYFRQVLSPEAYLLEMLIYRELCQYGKVKEIVADFTANYRQIFSAIENRQTLDNIPQFIQLALSEGVLQKRALAIQLVRSERNTLSRAAWADRAMRSELMQLGFKREHLIDADINRMLKTRVDGIASWLLDLREQAWFLDYEASMRMIQQNDDQADTYEPPKADKMRPNILFWPVTPEAWYDELMSYEVLVRDSCKSGALPPPPSAGGSR